MLLSALAIAVLIVAPWPLLRLLSIRQFRVFYTCFALRAVALVLLYALGVIALAVFLPALLAPAAVLAALVLALERWRARPQYGQARRWPPGSLALVPRGPWVDDRYFLRTAKRYGPLFKTSLLLFPMVCVIGAGRGKALLSEHGSRLQQSDVRYNRFIPIGLLRYMNEPHHGAYRKLFQRALSSALIKSSADAVDEIVADGLNAMAGAAIAAGGRGIRPAPYLDDMLFAAFMRLFFDIRRDSPEYAMFSGHYDLLDIRKAGCGSGKKEIEAGKAIADALAARASTMSEPQSDEHAGHTCVLSEIVTADAAAATDPTVLWNLVYLVQVGRNDLAGLLNWIVKMLVDHPKWIERLRDEAHGGGANDAQSLPQHIVRETLRLERSEFLFRRVREDIEFEGFVIPKGWRLRICIREGHRDPDVFEQPDAFNPDRFAGRTYRREEFSPLGIGEHACLGGQIVDRIGASFVRQLAAGYSLKAISDGPREYGAAHWQPSSRLRVALAPLAAS